MVIKLQKSNQKLYFISMLGIIPGLGAIVGSIMLLQGLFIIKDRFLALLGAIGIIITVIFFKICLTDMKYGKRSGEEMVPYSKNRLDSLDKDIKVFKSINGHYPDSLEQVQNKDTYIDI
jgi:hypothetical protein